MGQPCGSQAGQLSALLSPPRNGAGEGTFCLKQQNLFWFCLSMWRRGEVWSWGSNSRLHTCQVRAPTLTHTQINNCKVASGTFTTLYNHSCYLGPKHFVTQKEALPSSSPYSSFALLPDRSDHNLPSHHRLSGRVSWTQ